MRINKKIKFLISLVLVFIFLAAATVILKNFFLHQIEKKISSSFGYASIHFSFLPPSIILEKARSRSLNPFFSAKKMAISISFRSLLRKEKPLKVLIESPILRIYSSSSSPSQKKPVISLPFAIERGVIKEGEIYYWARKNTFQAKGINASFSQKKDRFWLKTEARKSTFYLASAQEFVTGRLKAWLEGQGKQIKVKRLEIVGQDGILKMEGSVTELFHPNFRFKTFLQTDMALAAKFLRLPFNWEGQVVSRGYLVRRNDILSFKGQISSQKLVLNKSQMGKIGGKIYFKQGQGGKVEFNILKRMSPAEFVRINFRQDKIWGKVSNFQLDPVMNYLSFPWPVYSSLWGNFTLDRNKLVIEGEFRAENLEEVSSRFPLNGQVSFSWDRKDRISFSSEEVESSFARLKVNGQAQINQNLEIQLQGEVKDLKQARQFTSLILGKEFNFPEIRGQGQAELRIFGNYHQPTVEAKFSFSPGGFDRFEVQSVGGEVEAVGDNFLGKFNVQDPFLKGKITLFSSKEGVQTTIQAEQGEVKTIFQDLNISFPLRGIASGNFEIKQKKGEALVVEGTFFSSLVRLENQPLKNVQGRLKWTEGSLSFSNLQFDIYQGKVGGSLLANLASRQFALDISGEDIDLASVYKNLGGTLFFNLKGKGLLGEDKASGQFEIRSLEFSPFKRTGLKGKLEVSYSTQVLSLKLEGNLSPGENKIGVTFHLPWGGLAYSAQIRGYFNNLDLLLPWQGAEGKINYMAEIKGGNGSPQIKGVIDFKGPLLPLPRFAHALHDYSGLAFVENGQFSLRSFKAKLGGGDVHGLGEIRFGKQGLTNISLRMAGKNMLLSPLERTRALTDGTLNLIKDSNRFVLEGDFLVHRLYWRRELSEKFVFSSRAYYKSSEQPSLFDDLTLNIHLKANDNAWIENSLGRIRARFDLTIGGSIKSPTVLGEAEALEGEVYFQDRKFKILHGLVSFFNPTTVEPYLNFKGETYIKNYRVSFSLTGFIDHLNPEFSSSPPLPPEDVLALLALGESFKRTYSYDTSTRLSTASFLSFQLSEEAKKRAGKLFSLDRFRIDPFILGTSAEMTARLTVGKKISRNIIILYSTNLTSQREEIARLEWELADNFSLVGIRDERGRFSLDVKIHKRF